MSRVSLSVLLMFVVCVVAKSQSTTKRTILSQAERELMQLEKDWSAAYLRHDTRTVDRILGDEYVGIDGRGISTNKAQEMKEFEAPKPGDPVAPFVVLEESVTDMKVRVYGNVAVVNGRVIEKIRSTDGEEEIQYARTTVWVRRLGRWRCVSFHGSRIIG